MKRAEPKSHCPINYALEVFGDSWSMLIVRDIVFSGKKTFSDFLNSEEAISTNVLASRLMHLEQKGILNRKTDENDKRREIYKLTERGIDLVPILIEMLRWSVYHDSETTAPKSFTDYERKHHEEVMKVVKSTLRSGGAIFSGPNSVVSKLRLKETTGR